MPLVMLIIDDHAFTYTGLTLVHTSTKDAPTRMGNVAKSTKAMRHCMTNAIAKVANSNAKFWTSKEMRSPIAALTVDASAERRAATFPLLFSFTSNQLTSFRSIPVNNNFSLE